MKKFILSLALAMFFVGCEGVQDSTSTDTSDFLEENDVVVEGETAGDEVPQDRDSDWLTYDFKEERVIFEYPRDWTVVGVKKVNLAITNLYLSSPTYEPLQGYDDYEIPGEITITAFFNPQMLSIEEFIRTKFIHDLPNILDAFEHFDTSFGGMPAMVFPNNKYDWSNYSHTGIYVDCNGKLVSLRYVFDEEEKYRDVLEQIASSVQCYFDEGINIGGLSVFQNEEMGIKFSYPTLAYDLFMGIEPHHGYFDQGEFRSIHFHGAYISEVSSDYDHKSDYSGEALDLSLGDTQLYEILNESYENVSDLHRFNVGGKDAISFMRETNSPNTVRVVIVPNPAEGFANLFVKGPAAGDDSETFDTIVENLEFI